MTKRKAIINMPDTPHWILLLIATLVATIGAATDLRSRRIPNWLTLSALPVGFGVGYALGGWEGLLSALAGMGLALLIYVPLWLLRAMGAGDAKLMMAIGCLIGPLMWVHLFAAASVVGGVVAVLFTLAKGQLKVTLSRAVLVLRSLAFLRAPYHSNPELDIRSSNSLTLPHGAVIALAWFVLLVLWENFDFRILRF